MYTQETLSHTYTDYTRHSLHGNQLMKDCEKEEYYAFRTE